MTVRHRSIGLMPVLLALTVLAPGAAAQAPAASLFQDFRWRNIGPANMAGRVSDIEAVESNPSLVYVSAASGGVWKSTNAGTTWAPIFTQYGTASVGDIAVFQPNPDIIWVGTGEANVRNSVGFGDGIYKSTDGGKTFINMGLKESHHIDRVVVHPTNPDLVYVASQGHLWDVGGDQGVFRTRDGGRTWQKLGGGLPNDGKTGASELVMDPSNPNILYAGFWERLREPNKFTSGGPNGGIYKSTDGGDTWTKLTNGLPTVRPADRDGHLPQESADPVAQVEHGFQPARNSADFNDMSKLGSGIYRSDDGGADAGPSSTATTTARSTTATSTSIPTTTSGSLSWPPWPVSRRTAARPSRGPSMDRRRLPRPLDRSRQQRSVLYRRRQGRVRHLRRRCALHHVRQHGHRSVLCGDGGQPRPVPRLRRPAGQRQLGRAEQQPRL